MTSPAIQQLQTMGGSSAQWLNAIANSNNWGPVLVLQVDAAPEPTKILLLLLGLTAGISRRRR